MVCVLLDLELEGNDTTRSKSSQGVRKNISIKLKNGDGATKSRGRSKRSTRSSSRSAAKPKKESPVVEKTGKSRSPVRRPKLYYLYQQFVY